MSSIRSRLVHDHDFHVGQDQLAAFEMVQQAARRGDQDIDALVDDGFLLLEADAAYQQRLGQLEILGVGVKVLGHLGGQFARGAQHKAARHPCAGAATGKHRQHREREAGCFAGAGLGNAQNIATFQGRGDGPRLDGGRGFVSGLVYGLEDLGVQVQVRKFCHVCPSLCGHCLGPPSRHGLYFKAL